MNKTVLTTAVISAVTGGVVGGAITYFTVNKALRTRYEEWANEEIDSVKARYALLRKDSDELDILAMAQNPSPEVQAAVDKGRKIIEQMGYSGLNAATPQPKEEEADDRFPGTVSIFDQAIDESEEEDEEDDYLVIEGEPYKISELDYFENGPGYSLDTLTYYEVDDTLCDEHNKQIDEVDDTIGERHLHMFHEDKTGNGKTSIYVQNDEHETLYEVILIKSSYASVVMGIDDETLGIKAPKERPKKMKRDGD